MPQSVRNVKKTGPRDRSFPLGYGVSVFGDRDVFPFHFDLFGLVAGEEGDNCETAGCQCEHDDARHLEFAGGAAVGKQEDIVVELRGNTADECRKTLGRVRLGAFDSAGDIYRAALRQEGFKTKGLSNSEAMKVYRAVIATKAGRRGAAMDRRMQSGKPSFLGEILNSINKE